MSIKTADYIANFLAEKGVKHVFTITGGGAMHLNNAFGKHKDLTCVYFHHEQACAIAAEGYARLTGKPVAVCVTSGPGGTNAMTGVMGAYLDSIPMFVVSGQVKYSTTVEATGLRLRQFGDQEYPIVKSVKRMTKYAKMVTDASDIKKMLQKAWRKMIEGRKGPVWLDVPLNIQGEMIEENRLVGDEKWPKVFVADDADIEVLIQKLQAAERPIILAGTGIRLAGAHAAFLKLVDHLGIPVATAWNAHDVMPDDHPLYAGRPGSVGDRAGNLALQKSDLMLVLGCRMNIRQISYNYAEFAPDTYKAVVDIDETELKKPSVKIDLPIHADLASVMDKLLAKKIAKKQDICEWIDWCQKTRARYPIPTDKQINDENGLNVYHFMGTLYDRLPDNANIIASNGSACVCGFQAAKIKENTRLFTNSGCAAMGYGLPAAIGAALSEHEGPVICLEGDGSLQMNIQELQTVKHYGLPIKLFVINNNGYQSIRQTQSNIFASDPMYGVDAKSGVSFPDLEKIANAYHLMFLRINEKDNMEATIDMALNIDAPVVVEVVVTVEQAFEPKLAAIRREDGSIYSPPPYDLSPPLSDAELKEVADIERKKG